MYRKIFFYCNIEIDLLMITAISQIIRKSWPKAHLVLIYPSTRRLKDDSNSIFRDFYDEVLEVKFLDIPSHIMTLSKGLMMTLEAINEVKKLKINKDDYFFSFDTFKFMDVLLFNYLKKRKTKIIILSAFIGKRFEPKNLRIRWHQTLVYNFYLLFSSKGKLYIDYKIKNTKFGGYRIYSKRPDYTIAMESSNTLMKATTRSFDKALFPIKFILPKIENSEISQGSNLLLIVSSLHGNRNELYWERVRGILSRVPSFFEIYVKDHPQGKSNLKEQLSGFNFVELEQKQNMERLIFKYGIKTVLGYASTGLITASWMGLRVYDYSNLLDFTEDQLKYYSEYLEMGENINFLRNYEDICNLDIAENKQVSHDINQIERSWEKILNKILMDEK